MTPIFRTPEFTKEDQARLQAIADAVNKDRLSRLDPYGDFTGMKPIDVDVAAERLRCAAAKHQSSVRASEAATAKAKVLSREEKEAKAEYDAALYCLQISALQGSTHDL